MMRLKSKLALVCISMTIGILVLADANAVRAADKSVKVGILVSYTGIAPAQAKMVSDGAELAFAEAGGKAAGMPIEVIKEDTEFNPTVALTKIRRLVEDHNVNFVVGPISSAVAMAIQDYVSKQNVILIIPCAFSRQLTTMKNARENIFRTVETTDQGNYPMGAWIFKNTPHRKVVVGGQDYAAGHDSVNAFKAGFEAAGGKVVKEVFSPIGTMDLASFLTTMNAAGADAVYVFYGGTDAVRFVQQYQEFGLKSKMPLFGYTSVADDPYLPSMGKAALGVISSTAYTASLDIPANTPFVQAYSAKYGDLPAHYSEYGYVAGKIIVTVADALKGDLSNASVTAKMIKQVAGQINTPSGPLEFDKYNQRIVNEYVQKVEEKDGKLTNVVIDKIGKVAQEDVWKWAN